jgi:predicted dehydrogenase
LPQNDFGYYTLKLFLDMKANRRTFIQTLSAASALAATKGIASPLGLTYIPNLKRISPNDKIRIATIGMGIQGNYDTQAALRNPDTELVAVADLYAGRLEHAKTAFGKDLFATRDYREILARPDIDAVLVVTPDHWHDHITIAALKAGKHVYCEKPMVQHINEGKPVIDAWKKSGKTMQVGSQRISSAAFIEAKRLVQAGDIGTINYIESNNDRFNAIGAWNYSVPPDASPTTVDWDRFLGDAPKRPFDANRFFRWRNYKDYGTGVAGDLFIHLITGVHFVTNTLGPTRVYASGNLAYWKRARRTRHYDERDGLPENRAARRVPDGAAGELRQCGQNQQRNADHRQRRANRIFGGQSDSDQKEIAGRTGLRWIRQLLHVYARGSGGIQKTVRRQIPG